MTSGWGGVVNSLTITRPSMSSGVAYCASLTLIVEKHWCSTADTGARCSLKLPLGIWHQPNKDCAVILAQGKYSDHATPHWPKPFCLHSAIEPNSG